MLIISLRYFCAVPLIFLLGCAAPPAATGPTRIALHVEDTEALINTAITVLREEDYPPREVDRQLGVVITHPSTGGQWFEPWRHDARGGYQLLESSLHTVRRVVTVQLAPTGGDRYLLDVQVDKSRYSAPERQVTTASSALAIYSEGLPTEQGLRAARSEGEHWVPLGRDALFEAYLLDRIVNADATVSRISKSD